MKKAWCLAAVVCAVLLVTALAVRWRAMRALGEASGSYASELDFAFAAHPLTPALDNGFEWISAPAVFSHAVVFQGKLFIAGPAGLFVYDARGNLERHYRVGRELPPAPLTCITQGIVAGSTQPALIIATGGEGVLLFDGAEFRQIRPVDPTARAVTDVLLLDSGQLLIATNKRGVLAYDGKKIGYFHPSLQGLQVTALAGTEADLWVGTLNRGVFHWHAGQLESFSEAEGLPDSAVHAVAVAGNTTYVGTSVGVTEFDSGRLARTVARDLFALSLYVQSDTLLVGTIEQGLVGISRRAGTASARQPGLGTVKQIFASGEAVYALANNELYRRSGDALEWKRVLEHQSTLLTDRNVSAVAQGPDGRLWVGYFDRGLDILETGGQHVTHIEDEHVYCVNRIASDQRRRQVDVATANGLVLFDAAGSKLHVLGRSNGLIANHVTDVVPYGSGMAIATPAGLTFLDSGGARSLYAFHGLVNNHVYALGSVGTRLMAGTLGGISQLEDEQVRVNYNAGTGGLKHNWVTAIVPVEGEWFVGTYGEGIMRLDSGGRFQSFDIATGAGIEVNPNAMLVAGQHVLAGTLGKGLYVYNSNSGLWTVVTTGLPSLNVTALAEAGGYVYVGTDNGLVRVSEASLN
jgi:ligand-binding sensor domain-containing protein